MTVGEIKKYLENYKDEDEFVVEMVPNYKLGVKVVDPAANIVTGVTENAKVE